MQHQQQLKIQTNFLCSPPAPSPSLEHNHIRDHYHPLASASSPLDENAAAAFITPPTSPVGFGFLLDNTGSYQQFRSSTPLLDRPTMSDQEMDELLQQSLTPVTPVCPDIPIVQPIPIHHDQYHDIQNNSTDLYATFIGATPSPCIEAVPPLQEPFMHMSQHETCIPMSISPLELAMYNNNTSDEDHQVLQYEQQQYLIPNHRTPSPPSDSYRIAESNVGADEIPPMAMDCGGDQEQPSLSPQLQHRQDNPNDNIHHKQKKLSILAAVTAENAIKCPDGTRIYKCPNNTCTKSYKNSNGLRYHLLKGSCEQSDQFDINAKPYYCRIQGCGKIYKNMNGLKYHGKVCHPEVNFVRDVKGIHREFSNMY